MNIVVYSTVADSRVFPPLERLESFSEPAGSGDVMVAVCRMGTPAIVPHVNAGDLVN